MQLVFSILMLLIFTWGILKFVSVRGGSSWIWASLGAAGYLTVELSVCYWMNESPSEYFLNSFPMAGIAWMILFQLAMRFRFRRTAGTNP
jgi:hypothetical protein